MTLLRGLVSSVLWLLCGCSVDAPSPARAGAPELDRSAETAFVTPPSGRVSGASRRVAIVQRGEVILGGWA